MDTPNKNNGSLPIINLSSTLTLRIKKNEVLIIFSMESIKKNKYMLLSISISNYALTSVFLLETSTLIS